ncbi:MAG: helix-turn-helix transcriptional regulator [Chloroflexota bacterium]|nr:helix-turn-helix transcriptional regulator [Chloroflexota bacterium]
MSTQFGELLREYRRRGKLSQKALAEKVGYHPSYVNRLERGTRMPPRQYDTIQKLATALNLTQEETNTLLATAGLEPVLSANIPAEVDSPRLRRIINALVALHRTPGITETQAAYVEETILLLLAGFNLALPTAELVPVLEVAHHIPQTAPPNEREALLDDLLSTVITGGDEYGGGDFFAVLEEVARGEEWELKRRIAEALPALLEVDPTHTTLLMNVLRADLPHPEWRTDIRRRVIEAAPALYKLDPEAARPLLRWHADDEVYAILASLEALAAIGDDHLQVELVPELLIHAPPEQREAIEFYVKLLENSQVEPDKALAMIERSKNGERLVRMCITRCLARLLPTRPVEALAYMLYFLRRVGGVPAEHQNVRRPLSRDLPRIIATFDGPHRTQAEEVIRELAQDEDVHIRRALSDVLPGLAQSHPALALELIQSYLIHDPDHYVRERTWKTLPRLATSHPEEVRKSCLTLFRLTA